MQLCMAAASREEVEAVLRSASDHQGEIAGRAAIEAAMALFEPSLAGSI